MKRCPLVALIVPVYNHKQDTREFLESMKTVTYPNYCIIITDDASTDGTEEMIRQEYPEVILLKGDGNLWWTGGVNIGTEKALSLGADYVLWIDNDTAVDPDFITYLVETAEKNPKSIVASKTYYYHQPEKIQQAGWEKKAGKHSYIRTGCNEIDVGQYESQRDIPCATMGSLIPTSIFKELGMLDFRNMPQYGSDADFTLRARKKGFRIIYEPKSKIWHKEMTSTEGHEPLPTKSFLSNLVFLTTNPRSVKYFRMNMVFMLRHAPAYTWPRGLAAYAWEILVGSLGH